MPSDDSKAAFGVFPQMRPHRRGKSNIGNEMIEAMFIPQDELDVALMLLPYGKAGRLAAAAALGLAPHDAEAGKIRAAVKSIQQMRDELMLKNAFDPSRRSLFGLAPTQDMAGRELAKVERQAAKEGAAPTVTKSTTSVSPDAGKTSKTVESIVQTPVSRRQVLQTAASQAIQGALPKGALPTPLSGVEDLVGQAAQAAAPATNYGLSAIPGLMAKLMRQGMSPEEAGRIVEGMVPGALNKWPEIVGERIQAPAERLPFISEESPLMSIFGEMVKPAFQQSPFGLRPEMRGLRELSPEDYEALKQTARDIKEYGFEP